MTRIENELHDLYECLMRNDDVADSDIYLTIVGIANNVAEMEAENTKLRELVCKQDELTKAVHAYWAGGERSLDDFKVMMCANAQALSLMRELRIEVKE